MSTDLLFFLLTYLKSHGGCRGSRGNCGRIRYELSALTIKGVVSISLSSCPPEGEERSSWDFDQKLQQSLFEFCLNCFQLYRFDLICDTASNPNGVEGEVTR